MKSWESLLEHAYTPYSDKGVACIVIGRTGKAYPGVRVENASFPLTIYAHQSAVFSCLSEGDEPEMLVYPEGHQPDDTVLAIWVSTYGLKVQTLDVMPDNEFGSDLIHLQGDESVFREALNGLQKYCRTDESDFQVSCLLEVEKNRFLSGVNIELSDWQAGLCAERVALAKAIALGYKQFESIHITTSKGEFISPCGACRQVLVEHLPFKHVHLYHPDGTHSVHTPADLLPAYFNGSSLRD